MRRALLCAVWIAAGLILGTTRAVAAAEPPVILVPPFENMSGIKAMINYEVETGSDPDRPKRVFRVDRYTEAPRAILEDVLGAIEGVKVLERKRVDALLLESEFGQLSGLVDSDKAVRMGQMLGANTIVMGTILDVRQDEKEFRGNGVHTKTSVVKTSIRIRVLDIKSGQVEYSNIVKGATTYRKSNFGGTGSSDVAYEVVEAALENLRADEKFQKAVFAKRTNKAADQETAGGIEIEFAPKPDNCDIEIDGKYLGGSPLKRTLPSGKEVKVTISKTGYKSWQKTITPEKGLRITPELARE